MKKRAVYKMILIGVIAGGAIGFLYYYFVGCSTGTCAITSNPITSILYGAGIGGLILNIAQKEFGKK